MTEDWTSPCGTVRLILGDCLEVLPGLGKVDAVVTSPPYNTLPKSHKPSGLGLHGERKSGVNKWIAKASEGYFDSRPEGEYQEWLRNILGQCFDITSGLMWVNHKVRYRDGEAIHPVRFLPWPIYSEIIWDRRGSMALNCKRFAPSHETILGFGRPHTWHDEENTAMSVWQIPFDRGTDDHPCAFPLEIAERPIRASTDAGDVVLDCFCGTGTTGEAAIRAGRRFIGIEIDPDYFAIAKRRIMEALGMEVEVAPGIVQGRMFAPEEARLTDDEIESLFEGRS